ncbi:MAG: NAD(P)H-hydrate epimerase [Rudaea sp.]
MAIPGFAASALPALTTDQMREVDRSMIEDFAISLEQMMENAGRGLAELARFELGSVQGQTIVVLAGSGSNGGGGMAAARHLANWGARVQVTQSKEPDPGKSTARQQLEILRRMGIPIVDATSARGLAGAALYLDALIGYGLQDAPRGAAAALIRLANESGRPIIALDTPSGLDTTSGEIMNPCMRARWTLTLALPKTGLLQPSARSVVGELFLADISVPPELYSRMGLAVPHIFAESALVRIDRA